MFATTPDTTRDGSASPTGSVFYVTRPVLRGEELVANERGEPLYVVEPPARPMLGRTARAWVAFFLGLLLFLVLFVPVMMLIRPAPGLQGKLVGVGLGVVALLAASGFFRLLRPRERVLLLRDPNGAAERIRVRLSRGGRDPFVVTDEAERVLAVVRRRADAAQETLVCSDAEGNELCRARGGIALAWFPRRRHPPTQHPFVLESGDEAWGDISRETTQPDGSLIEEWRLALEGGALAKFDRRAAIGLTLAIAHRRDAR